MDYFIKNQDDFNYIYNIMSKNEDFECRFDDEYDDIEEKINLAKFILPTIYILWDAECRNIESFTILRK